MAMTAITEDQEADTKTDESRSQENQDQDQDAATYEEAKEEPLTFAEMYMYLYEELKGTKIEETGKTVSAMEYFKNMFTTGFKTHPAWELSEDKQHYPDLTDAETEQIFGRCDDWQS